MNRDEFFRAGADLVSLCIGEHDQPTAGAVGVRGEDATLDLGGVGFIGAAGLGVLVALSDDLRRAGVRLRLRHASTRLRRLSAICDLDSALGLAPA